MKIALAQINPIVGALKKNKEKIISFIHSAREEGAELIVFPEMALCGYPPEDLLTLPTFCESVEKELVSLAEESQEVMVIVGGIRRNCQKKEKGLFNTAAIFQNGKLLGFQDKTLLPTYDVFSERRYFEPASEWKIWPFQGLKIAVTICEDIWQHAEEVGYSDYHIDPLVFFKEKNPDLMINISASPFYMGRKSTRFKVVSKAAQFLKCPMALCNMVGGNDGLLFDGTSLFVDKNGQLIKEAGSFREEELLLDSDVGQPENIDAEDERAELYEALIMGFRDYFFKSGFNKALLGLSGGIDSAVVACLAKEALGKENLMALMLPSRFTSQESLSGAKLLSNKLGIEYHIISIDPLYEASLMTLKPYFGDIPPNETEENLQARIRANILMAFSNKFGSILLNTSNKSESALGYTTLYGDLAGGLSILGDLSKSTVYELAHFINRGEEIIPNNIILREPSAELREGQKDSDSLPPYNIIDCVLKGYVEEHLSLEAIAEKYSIDFSLVKDLIRRIHVNEYKRRQAPLALRVTKKAFATGRHFPIVQHWNRWQ